MFAELARHVCTSLTPVFHISSKKKSIYLIKKTNIKLQSLCNKNSWLDLISAVGHPTRYAWRWISSIRCVTCLYEWDSNFKPLMFSRGLNHDSTVSSLLLLDRRTRVSDLRGSNGEEGEKEGCSQAPPKTRRSCCWHGQEIQGAAASVQWSRRFFSYQLALKSMNAWYLLEIVEFLSNCFKDSVIEGISWSLISRARFLGFFSCDSVN